MGPRAWSPAAQGGAVRGTPGRYRGPREPIPAATPRSGCPSLRRGGHRRPGESRSRSRCAREEATTGHRCHGASSPGGFRAGPCRGRPARVDRKQRPCRGPEGGGRPSRPPGAAQHQPRSRLPLAGRRARLVPGPDRPPATAPQSRQGTGGQRGGEPHPRTRLDLLRQRHGGAAKARARPVLVHGGGGDRVRGRRHDAGGRLDAAGRRRIAHARPRGGGAARPGRIAVQDGGANPGPAIAARAGPARRSGGRGRRDRGRGTLPGRTARRGSGPVRGQARAMALGRPGRRGPPPPPRPRGSGGAPVHRGAGHGGRQAPAAAWPTRPSGWPLPPRGSGVGSGGDARAPVGAQAPAGA